MINHLQYMHIDADIF